MLTKALSIRIENSIKRYILFSSNPILFFEKYTISNINEIKFAVTGKYMLGTLTTPLS